MRDQLSLTVGDMGGALTLSRSELLPHGRSTDLFTIAIAEVESPCSRVGCGVMGGALTLSRSAKDWLESPQ